MNNTDEIIQFLIQTVKSFGPISGAQLGARIKAQFPTFDLRKEFGTLQRFIRMHCSSEVILVGTEPDHTWALADGKNGKELTNEAIATVSTPSAWQALVNERIQAKLFVNPENGDISVFRTNATPPATLCEIKKISREEHLQIAKDFINQVDVEDKIHFQPILEKSDYWQNWNSELKYFKGGQYLIKWHEFRLMKIYDLYAGRLRTAGIQSEDLLAKGIENLKRLRIEAHSQKKRLEAPLAKSLQKLAPERSWGYQNPPLQAIAFEAVKALSEEDLRRLWLPLGVVIDALRRN